mgnify:FL=1
MSILDRIVATKREQISAAKAERPESALQDLIRDLPPTRDFFQALATPGPIRLIAEVKKASPSKGLIREDFSPAEIAHAYAQNGATCISVLTDPAYFQGSLDDLQTVRRTVDLPLLRKDFILERYQLLEARASGADAVLLIAECLDDCALRGLHQEALELGLTPLVEFYDVTNAPRVLAAGATLIGVNNRNLHTFETDLNHTLSMRAQIPPECLLVGESGIHTRADVLRLEQAGVDAILVGERLMASPDIAAAVRGLLGTSGDP